MTQVQPPASVKQRGFALRLAGDRALPELGSSSEERIENVDALFEGGLGRRDASVLIDRLLAAPRDRTDGTPDADQPGSGDVSTDRRPLVRPGVYRLNDHLYVVRPTRRDPTRVYASRLVSAPPRVMESGSVEKLELEYARGAIFDLREEHRLEATEVEEVSRRYGRCIYCGQTLKAAKSVQRMVGPVCWKRVL